MEIFCLRAHESIDTILSLFVPPKWLWVNTISNVINTAVLLCDTDNSGTSLSEEFGSPISDITKTLDDDLFACNSGLDA